MTRDRDSGRKKARGSHDQDQPSRGKAGVGEDRQDRGVSPGHRALRTFSGIIDGIYENLAPEIIYRRLLESTMDITGCEFGLTAEVNSDNKMDILVLLTKDPKKEGIYVPQKVDHIDPLPVEGLWKETVSEDAPHMDNSHISAPRGETLIGLPEDLDPLEQILTVPFKVMGRTRGIIVLANKEDGFDDDDMEMMLEIANLVSIGRSRFQAMDMAMRNSADGIALVDRNGVLSMVNPALERMFGYRASEIEGRSLLGLFLDLATGSPLGDAIAGAVLEGTWSGEAVALRRDGSSFPVHLSLTAIDEGSAGRTGFMALVRDITSEKEARDRARLYLETAGVMILALDLEGRVTMVNRTGEEILGMPREDLIGKDWFRTCVPESHRERSKRVFEVILGSVDRAKWPHEGLRARAPVNGFDTSIDGNGSPANGSGIEAQGIRDREPGAPPEDTGKPGNRSSVERGRSSVERGRSSVENTLDDHMDGPPISTIEGETYPIVDGEGNERILHWQHTLLRNPKGIVVGLLSSGNDITERVRAEEKLKESEEIHKSLLRASPYPVVISDLDGNIVNISQRILDLHGLKNRRELLGRSSLEFIVPEDRDKARRYMERTLEEGIARTVEYRMIRGDGEIMNVELSASVIRDAEGEPWRFIAILRNITEEKEAERKLKEAEERYRTIFENSNTSIIRSRLEDGAIVMANQAAAGLLGYDTVDEMKEDCVLSEHYSEERRREYVQRLRKYGRVEDFEIETTRRDGGTMYVMVSARLDRETGVIDSIGIDITKLREAERKREEAEESYRNVFEYSPVGAIRSRVEDGKIVMANRVAALRLGYDSIEDFLENCRTTDIYPAHIRERILETLKEKGSFSNMELTVKRKDGSDNHLLVSASIDPSGKFIDSAAVNINQIKEMEEKLKEAEERYRSMFEDSPMGIMRTEAETGRVLMANDTAVEHMGYDSVEDMKENCNMIESFKDPERADMLIDCLREDGVIRDVEVELMRKDGSSLFMLLGIRFDEEAGIVDAAGIDITRWKEAEMRLEAGESMYETLLQSDIVGFGRTRVRDGKILRSNLRGAKGLGYSSVSELMEVGNITEHFPLEERERFLEALQEDGHVSNYELDIHTRDGKKRTFLVNARLNETEGYLDNISIDVTDWKRMEERLRETEERYRLMFRSSSVGQARVRVPSGRVLLCNQAFAHMMGYPSPKEVKRDLSLGKHVIHEDEWSDLMADLRLNGITPAGEPRPSDDDRGSGEKDDRDVPFDPDGPLRASVIPHTPMAVRGKDGRERDVTLSGVVYLDRGYADLTFIDTALITETVRRRRAAD